MSEDLPRTTVYLPFEVIGVFQPDVNGARYYRLRLLDPHDPNISSNGHLLDVTEACIAEVGVEPDALKRGKGLKRRPKD